VPALGSRPTAGDACGILVPSKGIVACRGIRGAKRRHLRVSLAQGLFGARMHVGRKAKVPQDMPVIGLRAKLLFARV
jgi:hypothetical protein